MSVTLKTEALQMPLEEKMKHRAKRKERKGVKESQRARKQRETWEDRHREGNKGRGRSEHPP